jgi:isochorismate synthase
MQITDDKYKLYAGGGLLKESQFQSEWLETEAKLETMRALFK